LSLSQLQINNFKDLFTGNIHNYGQHEYIFSEKGIKEKGKNYTVKDKLITAKQYREHLSGSKGLGVIPINEDNMCKIAILDVDIYDIDFKPYLDAIEKYRLPLVPFYSKSGGLHIYIFFKEFVKAKDATSKALELAKILGITLLVKKHKNETLEIFPKQTKLNVDMMGSWINLPYFNIEDTKQGLIHNGKVLGFNDALTFIKSKLTTIDDLTDLIDDLPYSDAPPCLQSLYMLNMLGENSGRNNYLFSFGVYLKKKDENYFEQSLISINNELNEPLEVQEIEKTVLSSLRKKDYTYKCKASPCLDFCDKKVCQSKLYGIGKDGGFFTNIVFGSLKQYKSAVPYYEWEVKDQESKTFKTLRFKNEDEIIKQDVFLRLCIRELRFLPYKMKQGEWFKLVNQALADITVIDVNKDDDTSPVMRFNNMFYDFITARALAQTKEQVLNKRVYYDKKEMKYYFRTKDLLYYLYEIKNFRMFSSGDIHGMLRDIGATSTVLRTDIGRQIRTMAVKRDSIDQNVLAQPDTFDIDFDSFFDEEEAF